MSELKPCPFCGGEARMTKIGHETWVECSNYHWKWHQVCAYAATEAEAIEAWNTRATLRSGKLTAEQVRVAIERNFGKVAVVDDGGETVEWRDGWTCNVGCDFKAIADELNATLGGGECKWVWVESWTDTTDGRECDYAHWMPDCGCWSEGDYQFSDFDDYEEKPTGIVFCERCGKAVK